MAVLKHALRTCFGASKRMRFEPVFQNASQNTGHVVCIDWTELAGRGYVVLNMTKNLNCEEFRSDKGVRLLRILERVFARRMNSPEGSWVLYLSKPVHQQRQLLMNVASEHGVIATKDVLDMLGEIRKSLDKVGIQNYSSASSCQARPSQTRSDYGKLFVVLVIIGSVCTIIITSGFIYICWQRRLPAKTTFRAEELRFVENACHDNPTLDVTNDNQSEMQEKKPSANGLQQGSGGGATAGGGGAREERREEGQRRAGAGRGGATAGRGVAREERGGLAGTSNPRLQQGLGGGATAGRGVAERGEERGGLAGTSTNPTSAAGLRGGATAGGGLSTCVFVNQAATEEEEEEQDTHL
ncbi:hypothetical protein WMY93_012077 [Mugilogobius chulae]|uniref:Uncharacterized protein n=1 Tax=Mugilogobius chulae TaxID=88201 RepID=A0AAW0P7Q6_9GOBI